MSTGDSLTHCDGRRALYQSQFRPVFEKQAADIINPDVCNCGGILELKEIAAMAEPYYVTVSPHNYNSTTIGLAATLQVAATMPNFLTEYFVNFEARAQEVATVPFQVDHGYIACPLPLDWVSSYARRCWRGIPIANFHCVAFPPFTMKAPDSGSGLTGCPRSLQSGACGPVSAHHARPPGGVEDEQM